MKLLMFVVLILTQGCMSTAIGGLGLGWDSKQKEVEPCSQSVIDSYRASRQLNSSPDLKHDYEVTFDCKLEGES